VNSDADRRGGDGTGHPGGEPVAEPRSGLSLAVVGLLALLGFVGFASLGVWQIERRAWKLDLIARVDARIHAAPVAAPGPAQWSSINRKEDEYRRVSISGEFLNDRETLVTASTEDGAGYWVLTPLKTKPGFNNGFTVLINRGFVPTDRKDRASRAAGEIKGETTVTGLMRMTEPKGAFLRGNDISAERWYSRDVDAIAIKRGLDNYAPYFIDADATPNQGGYPVGGLTVVGFPNNHLVYALTWFGLALMVLGASIRFAIEEVRIRRTAKRIGAAT
jgi:surfeit locus 1 family protein